MIEVVFTVMMALSCDINTFNELEWHALMNSQTVDEAFEDEIRSHMRRYYMGIKMRNIIAKYKLQAKYDN